MPSVNFPHEPQPLAVGIFREVVWMSNTGQGKQLQPSEVWAGTSAQLDRESAAAFGVPEHMPWTMQPVAHLSAPGASHSVFVLQVHLFQHPPHQVLPELGFWLVPFALFS